VGYGLEAPDLGYIDWVCLNIADFPTRAIFGELAIALGNNATG